MKPFRRQPFESLPETPRRPHDFLQIPVEKVRIASRPLGTLDVAVRRRGSGPPLLLLHGLMTSSYSWRYVITPLAQRWTVIAPDLPGAGDSDVPDAKLTPEALSEFIGELQRALGIRGCDAVGNSMGGYLCMRRALDDEGAFARLVNLHSPALPTMPLRALHAMLALPGTRALVVKLVRRDPQRWAHRNVHYFDDTLKSREEARIYGRPLASLEGARAFVSYLGDTLAPRGFVDFARRLRQRREFPIPLLHLYARRDPLVPAWIGPRIAELTHSPLAWIDDTSHFMHVDTPAPVIAHLEQFLAPAAMRAAE